MARTTALSILGVVELGSVIYTAISLHGALVASSPGDAVLIPLLTALAMLAVYGVLTGVALQSGGGDSDGGNEPS